MLFGSRQETVEKALAALKEENPEWEVSGAWPKLTDAKAVADEMAKIKEKYGRIDLARELGPFHIRVNAVAPGITKTDMVAALPKEMIEPLVNRIPLRRIGEAEDIANAFLFLASEMASYVTGEVLSVDGAMRSEVRFEESVGNSRGKTIGVLQSWFSPCTPFLGHARK